MSTTEQHGRRMRIPLVALAVLLVLVGTIVLVRAAGAQQHAPQPPASAGIAHTTAPAAPSGPLTTGRASTGSAAAGTAKPKPVRPTGPILSKSQPTRVDIPAIGVSSDLLQLGLNPDRTVQVPPLSKDSRAGWYRYSPTPGQLGPSVLLGHVDSKEYGPGIFFKLGALRQGDTVSVTRADSTVAVFRIDRVVSYPKNQFPTLEVYGNTDKAELRLITCGGKFDFSSHNYLSNIVAYATLAASHPA
ncbi:class F sortase [Jatrophihabitans lederbergiae]|uniref:Class F sortase n=1 Tax=Jatrophihabitans lederbergiae TaxID=3075547 RepID=A0ABU2J8H9_9ACTN|nr:class F sortase [Jatrophihabitans sp. DSM 44399]MDT0260573.1 class F sortase [Jatrophihabitans sp. DSM 44399]